MQEEACLVDGEADGDCETPEYNTSGSKVVNVSHDLHAGVHKHDDIHAHHVPAPIRYMRVSKGHTDYRFISFGPDMQLQRFFNQVQMI